MCVYLFAGLPRTTFRAKNLTVGRLADALAPTHSSKHYLSRIFTTIDLTKDRLNNNNEKKKTFKQTTINIRLVDNLQISRSNGSDWYTTAIRDVVPSRGVGGIGSRPSEALIIGSEWIFLIRERDECPSRVVGADGDKIRNSWGLLAGLAIAQRSILGHTRAMIIYSEHGHERPLAFLWTTNSPPPPARERAAIRRPWPRPALIMTPQPRKKPHHHHTSFTPTKTALIIQSLIICLPPTPLPSRINAPHSYP